MGGGSGDELLAERRSFSREVVQIKPSGSAFHPPRKGDRMDLNEAEKDALRQVLRRLADVLDNFEKDQLANILKKHP